MSKKPSTKGIGADPLNPSPIGGTPSVADSGNLSVPAAAQPDPDNAVGYGQPPKTARWKKGQSGNPKGKPKGSKSLKTVLTQWANGKIVVKKNGKAKIMSNLEALVQHLYHQSLSGNTKAAATLLQLAKQYVLDEIETAASEQLSPEDAAILKNRAAFMALVEEIAGGYDDEKGDDD